MTDEELGALTMPELIDRLRADNVGPAEWQRVTDRKIELSVQAVPSAPRPASPRLDESDVARAERELTAAAEQYREEVNRGLKTLQRTDGRQFYSAEERAEREQKIRADAAAKRDKVQARWLERGEEAVADADRREAIARGQDPLKRLSTADQARAASRREFVAEDCRGSTFNLERRVASVVAEKDVAEATLYSRYIGERLERSGNEAEVRSLRGMLAQLEQLTANPADEQERRTITQLRDTGRRLRQAAWSVDREEQVAALQAEMVASGRYGAGGRL
jgi:hypothetical protein